MFPYLDIHGFKRRTSMPDGDVDMLASVYPGFVEQQIASVSSWINARLRKRYGQSASGATSLPLGQRPPALVAAGTSPPPVALAGRPVLGSLLVTIAITTGGTLGAALFSWSIDGGLAQVATGVATGAAVVLGSTGLSAVFPPGTYGTDNVYAAATPVPETVLGWLTTLVTWRAYAKRGVNPQDPMVTNLKDDVDQVYLDVKEAADSKDGLIDLPASEDVDSAVTTSGPRGYAEASPYAAFDAQRRAARLDDSRGFGS